MKKLLLLLGLSIPGTAAANPACPVCTIAVGVGLDIARHIGVPDSVVGLWAGALLALLGYWTIHFMNKKNWHFRGRNTIVMIISIAMIGFAYIGTATWNPTSICGVITMDPLLFGTLIGAGLFIGTEKLYDWMKARNNGHAHFPFEKVVLPVIVLALTSWWMIECL